MLTTHLKKRSKRCFGRSRCSTTRCTIWTHHTPVWRRDGGESFLLKHRLVYSEVVVRRRRCRALGSCATLFVYSVQL